MIFSTFPEILSCFVLFCNVSFSPKVKPLIRDLCQISPNSSRNLSEESSRHTGKDDAKVPWETVLFKGLNEELPLFSPNR